MNNKQFLDRLNLLMTEGMELTNNSIPVRTFNPLNYDISHFVKCKSWWLSCFNLLRSFFGESHPFYNSLKNSNGKWAITIAKDVSQPIPFPMEDMASAYAVLLHIKKEFELGLVNDARHLYESDLFSNLLDQSFELVEKNYLVASAVYCRLIIENFINDLCRIKEIKLEEKDKSISIKLTKLREKEVFDLPTERLIQAKYDIGTYAVHGMDNFMKYSKQDIIDLLETTRDKVLTIR